MKIIPNYCQHPVYWDPRIHLLYVLDTRRVEAFAAAIRETVRPGMIVADIGTGTGILARIAAEAGAERVYAIERHPEILEYAARANEQLQLDDRIVLVEGDALEVDLPEPVDVIVSETIGSIGNDEGISRILARARRKWLTPFSGTIIPSRVEALFAPVDVADAWPAISAAYDHDVLIPREQQPPLHGAYYEVLGLSSADLLAPARTLDAIDLLAAEGDLAFTAEHNFRIGKAGKLGGMAAWFRAKLSPTTDLDTSPDAPSTCWGQAFFPFRFETDVGEGDSLSVQFAADSLPLVNRPFYTWEATLESSAGTTHFEASSNRAAVERGEQQVRTRRLRKDTPAWIPAQLSGG